MTTANTSLIFGLSQFGKQGLNEVTPLAIKARELVIFDAGIDHVQQLIDGVKPGIDWVVLNSNQDGIEQITRILANYSEITTLHLVSHGAPGCLFLGNTQLSLDTLEGYTTQLQSWFASSPPSPQNWRSTGDLGGKKPSLLLYGCKVAAGDAGGEFIHKLHNITQANIAASRTLTGNKALGGDWELEVKTAQIEPVLALQPEIIANYNHVLVELSPGTAYGTGEYPVSAVSGDFDGDGNQDLATANFTSNDISVLLGSGDGTFGTATTYGLGTVQGNFDISTGDLNNDGKLDLAVTHRDSNEFSILLGNGDGTFGAATTYDISDRYGNVSPFSITIQDFNNDGLQDLVIGQGRYDISILPGNGDGTFGTATLIDIGLYGPLYVTVGDFNNDGNLDLATAHESGTDGQEDISVVLGNSNGTFGSATTYTTGVRLASDIQVGDFNQDGKQDLAVAHLWAQELSILLGNGDGTFGATTNYANVPGDQLTISDFDNDGIQDIATDKLAILTGKGDGTFNPPVNFPTSTNDNISIASGDFDNDGYLDLVSTRSSHDVFVVLVNHAPTDIALNNANVNENEVDGAVVGTLSTIDPNSPDSHTYTLVNDAGGRFGISGDQIVVADGSLLDFETDSSHTVRVQTTDPDGLTYEKDFVVGVNNLNDAPEINNQTFDLAEDATNSSSVGIVTASDADGDNLTYSITAGNDNNIFNINAFTGEITVNDNSQLDFETTDNYDLTIEVDDSQYQTSATITVNITDANDAPEIQDQTLTLAEDATNGSLVGTVTASDADGDNLSYSITAGNENGIFAINSNTGEITLADSAQIDFETTESYDLTVEVSDSVTGNSAAVTVNITDVNEVPEFTSTAPLNATEDSAYSYNIVIADPDAGETLTITAPTLPDWLTLTDNGDGTATLTGTPNNTEVGDHTVELQVEDAAGEIDTQSFTVEIKNTNDVPTIAGTPNTTIDEDSSYSFIPTAEDIDGDVLSFSIENKPDWANFDSATGELSGTPENEDVGTTENIVISVTDGTETVELDPFSLEVANTNDVPEITSTAPTSSTQGFAYTYNIVIDDPDIGDNLTITAPTLPDWLTLTDNGDGTATLSGTPNNTEVGDHNVELQVEDAAGEIQTQSFTIKVKNTNDAPTITGTPNTTVDEDSSYSFIPTAEDLDGDDLSFSIENQPDWANFDSTTGELSGTPENEDVGTTENIVISVTDGTETVELDGFNLEVVNTNDAPEMTSVAPTNTDQSFAYTYNIVIDDPDAGDNLTITAPTLPDWLTLTDNGNGTATLSGTPGNEHVGEHTIELQVEDSEGEIDTQSFTLNVNNLNDAPTITGTPNTSIDEDSSYSFIPTAEDVDGDTLSFSIENQPDWANFDSTTGELSGTPENEDVGTTENIIISTSDGTVTAVLDAFSLEVVNVNNAPEIISITLNNTDPSFLYNYDIVVNDADVGDNLTITATNLPDWLTLTDNGDGTATLNGTPDNDKVSGHTIEIQVEDSAGEVDTQSLTLEADGEKLKNIVSNLIEDLPQFADTFLDVLATATNFKFELIPDGFELTYLDSLNVTNITNQLSAEFGLDLNISTQLNVTEPSIRIVKGEIDNPLNGLSASEVATGEMVNFLTNVLGTTLPTQIKAHLESLDKVSFDISEAGVSFSYLEDLTLDVTSLLGDNLGILEDDVNIITAALLGDADPNQPGTQLVFSQPELEFINQDNKKDLSFLGNFKGADFDINLASQDLEFEISNIDVQKLKDALNSIAGELPGFITSFLDSFADAEFKFKSNEEGLEIVYLDTINIQSVVNTLTSAIGLGSPLDAALNVTNPGLRLIKDRSGNHSLEMSVGEISPGEVVNFLTSLAGASLPDSIQSKLNSIGNASFTLSEQGISLTYLDDLSIDLNSLIGNSVGSIPFIQDAVNVISETLLGDGDPNKEGTQLVLVEPGLELTNQNGKQLFKIDGSFNGQPFDINFADKNTLFTYELDDLDLGFLGIPGLDGFKLDGPILTFSQSPKSIEHDILGRTQLVKGFNLMGGIDFTKNTDDISQFINGYLGVENVGVHVGLNPDKGASLEGVLGLDIPLLSIGDFGITFSEAELSLETTPSSVKAGIGGSITLEGYDPIQDNEPPLTLFGGLEFDPKTITGMFEISADGAWKNPFGLPDTELRNLAVQIGATYISPYISNVGFVGDLKFGNFDLAAAFFVDVSTPKKNEPKKDELQRFALQLTANSPISLVDLIMGPVGSYVVNQAAGSIDVIGDALDFLNQVIDIKAVSIDGPDEDTELDPLIKIVPVKTQIVSTTLEQGIGVNAAVTAWGQTAKLNFNANPFSKKPTSVTGSLELSEIDLGGIVKISGANDPNLSLDFKVSPSEQYLRGDGRLEILGHEVAKADFEVTPTLINIRDFDLDLGLVAFDVNEFKVSPTSFSASGFGSLKILGREVAKADFEVTPNLINIRDFDLDLGFVALDVDELKVSPTSLSASGSGSLEILGKEVAKADFDITPTSINIRDFDLDLGFVALDVDEFKVNLTSLTASGSGSLEFLGHELAKADFEVSPTSISIRDFDLDLGVVAFNIDDFQVNPTSLSASGSGGISVLGQDILTGQFQVANNNVNVSSYLGYSILGVGVGVNTDVSVGLVDNSLALTANFMGIRPGLRIDIDDYATGPASIYGWAQDLVEDELAAIARRAAEAAARAAEAAARAVAETARRAASAVKSFFRGWGFNSYIEDAEVFFDANLNGIRDINEPFSMTEADGSYEFPISWEEYDLNQNGTLDPTEGLIVVQGGTYVSSGLPLEAPMTAVPGYEVVTPLTTLVAELSVMLEIEPEVAELQVKSALGLPEEINLGTFNYLEAIANGDPNGLKVYAAAVQVQNTLVTLTKVLEGAAPDSMVSVAKLAAAAMGGYAIAASVQEDQSFDLSQPETLQIILESTLDGASNEDEAIDPEQLSEVSELVVQAVTASNQQIQEVANSEGDLTELAKNITRIQKVALGDVAESLSQLAAGTKTIEEFAAETTPEAIEAKIAETVVSDPTFRPEVVRDDSDEDIVEEIEDTSDSDPSEDNTVEETEDASGSEDNTVEETEDASGSGEDIVEGTEDASGSETSGDNTVEETGNTIANASGSNQTGSSNLHFIGSVIGSGSGSTAETNSFDPTTSIPEIISPVQLTMADMTGSMTEATVESDLMMGNGIEPIFLFEGHDTLMADSDDNWVNGNQGNDMMDVGPGNDTVHGGKDNDTVFGSAGNDWINGNKGADFLDGGDGMDTLYGGEDSDTLQSNTGDDWLSGNKGADLLDGGDGMDTLYGGQDNDMLQGGAEDDELFGNLGADLIEGNDGNDLIHGGQDNDTVSGNNGDDTVHGDRGNDILNGGEGNDQLIGDAGDDILFGAAGADTLTGGAGQDQFVLTSSSGSDLITDFTHGEDMIILEAGLTFEQLTIEPTANATIIKLGEQVLATLNGVHFSLINVDDFNSNVV